MVYAHGTKFIIKGTLMQIRKSSYMFVSLCVNGSAMFLVKSVIFFWCLLMVLFVFCSTFFSTALSSINSSTEDKMFCISFSEIDKFFFKDLSSFFLLLTTLLSKCFLMHLLSYWLTLGKLNERNFGTTLRVWQIITNVKSSSAFLIFFLVFSYFRNCSTLIVSYFCTYSYIKLPRFQCTIK